MKTLDNIMDRWIISFTQSLLLFMKQEMAGKVDLPRKVKLNLFFLSDFMTFLRIGFMDLESIRRGRLILRSSSSFN